MAVLKNGGNLLPLVRTGSCPISWCSDFLFPADDALCSESSEHATDATIRATIRRKINRRLVPGQAGLRFLK